MELLRRQSGGVLVNLVIGIVLMSIFFRVFVIGLFRIPSNAMMPTLLTGDYIVLGDNRDKSHDSRYWGFVPAENVVGRVFMIWMNWDGWVNWDRVGTSI